MAGVVPGPSSVHGSRCPAHEASQRLSYRPPPSDDDTPSPGNRQTNQVKSSSLLRMKMTPAPQVQRNNKVKSTTHTCLTALCLGLPGGAGTRKVKPIWILLKQETVSGSGISWAICKSAPRSRQITTPAPQHSVFLQAGCPSCCPTNSTEGKTKHNEDKLQN